MAYNSLKRVLVTRQAEQSISFINALSHKGHCPFLLPMIETTSLHPNIEKGEYDIIFFTSSNAVKYFMPYHESIKAGKYMAVGEKTAYAMDKFLGVPSSNTPTTYDLKSLLEMIYSMPLENAKILSPGALNRLELPFKELEEKGAKLLAPAVYKISSVEYPQGYIDKFIEDNKINIITFCSPSACKSFLSQFQGDKSALDIITIGDTTYNFLEKYGIVSRHPDIFTVEAMAEII